MRSFVASVLVIPGLLAVSLVPTASAEETCLSPEVGVMDVLLSFAWMCLTANGGGDYRCLSEPRRERETSVEAGTLVAVASVGLIRLCDREDASTSRSVVACLRVASSSCLIVAEWVSYRGESSEDVVRLYARSTNPFVEWTNRDGSCTTTGWYLNHGCPAGPPPPVPDVEWAPVIG